jgi:hypothetical protein
MERDAEIDQIKQELAVLQARYARYRRIAQRVRSVFIVLAVVLAIGALAFAIELFLFDALYGAFFTGAIILFAGAMTWFTKSSGLRWIDVASPYFRGIYSPNFFYPDAQQPKPYSEADWLEQQIADRERRLSQLGETVPGRNGTD